MKRYLAAFLALLVSAGLTYAQEDTDPGFWDRTFRYERDGALFRSPELSLDVFGTYADRDRGGRDGDHWGGGVGLNYFFNRFIGIAADTYIEEWRWPYRVSGSGLLRVPLDFRDGGFALYGFGGGGRQFKFSPQYFYHAGAGLEFRFNPHTGIFGDARRVFPDDTADYTLVRAGFRFAF